MTTMDYILGFIGAFIYIGALVGIVWLLYWLDGKRIEIFAISQEQPLNRNGLIEAVCYEFSITREEIRSHSRKKNAVDARKVYCYLARKHYGATTPDVASDVNRNQSTAVHATIMMNEHIESNDPLVLKLRKIEESIFKT